MPRSSSARDRLVATTRNLLRRQGYHATGLNQIIEESEAPKGSLYHYFPGGKEELAVEAVRQSAADMEAGIQTAVTVAKDTKEALGLMAASIVSSLQTSGFAAACPITTVALETATLSAPLQEACSQAFESMRAVIKRGLEGEHYPPEQADELSNLMLAVYLGSLVLSRTHRDVAPIEHAVATLQHMLPAPRPKKKG